MRASPGVFAPLALLAGEQPGPFLPAAAPRCSTQPLARSREVLLPSLFVTPSSRGSPASLFGMPVAGAARAPDGERAEICPMAAPLFAKPTNAEARIKIEMAILKPRMTASSSNEGIHRARGAYAKFARTVWPCNDIGVMFAFTSRQSLSGVEAKCNPHLPNLGRACPPQLCSSSSRAPAGRVLNDGWAAGELLRTLPLREK